jgi:hypothetical protein
MSKELDLDDCAAQSELAVKELAELRADNKRLREALEQAEKWFSEYAEMHNEKGKYEKAVNNKAKSFYCRAALDESLSGTV